VLRGIREPKEYRVK